MSEGISVQLEATCQLVAGLVEVAASADHEARVRELLAGVPTPLAVFTAAPTPWLLNTAWRERFSNGPPPVTAAELDRVRASRKPAHFTSPTTGVVYPTAHGLIVACIGDARSSGDVRDQFFAIVSHELRAPITAILIWERILRDDRLDLVMRRRALDAIHDSATQQAQLVADLLDISRAMSGKLHVDLRVLAIDRLVTGAIHAAQAAALAKHQDLIYRGCEQLALVRGDANRLGQILGNVLSNAVRHTGEHGTIIVTTRNTSGSVVIEISDTGRGITSEFLPHVFDPFSQAEGGGLDGLGLGLAIAHQLVSAHRGSLTASSAGAGQGATFTLTLPRTTQLLPAAETPAAERLSGIRLLVVDDDRRVLEALQVLLEQSGAVVDIADSAAAGIGALSQAMPDAILSDLAMPGEDGYAFVDRARRIRGAGKIPAIAITAHASEADRTRALASGFDLYLTKPLRVDRLISEVVRLVDSARAANT
ncbi:MAG: hybrid sensor histidine kinase/response regulator [Kofleriaceae bacterium]